MSLTLQFLGAAGDVTGSCYLIRTDTVSFLVDCGLFQGKTSYEKHNYEDFKFDPTTIDFMILTHAHLDHCGLIPKLVKWGFEGKIFSTPATFDLTQAILTDAAQIQEQGVRDEEIELLFGIEDAVEAFTLFETHEYQKEITSHGIKFRFQDAGHILGAASVEVWVEDKKIVFSGDIGNSPVPILKDPAAIHEADYVLCESTYGDRLHSSVKSREKQLYDVVMHTQQQGGKLVIPSFALERSQDLLYVFNKLKNEGKLNIPVILDSPLAIKITDIYKGYKHLFDDDFQAQLKADPDLFSFQGFEATGSVQQSKTINDLSGPAVIIAGSGMADAGRVQHHLLHKLPGVNNTVLFVGYQSPGTLGRKLLGRPKFASIHGHKVKVRAHITSIDSFSSHADQKGLLNWLGNFKNKPIIFLTHGEDLPRIVLAERLGSKNLTVHQPKMYQTYEL